MHREHFDANEVQLSTLLSIKTGGCPEDCGYCPQAARFDTGVEAGKLMPLDEVVEARAGREGAGRDALLHGRGVARPEGARPRARARDGARGAGARPGDLLTLGMLDAGQAER